MKNHTIVFAVLIVVALGAFFLFSQKSEAPAVAEPAAETTVADESQDVANTGPLENVKDEDRDVSAPNSDAGMEFPTLDEVIVTYTPNGFVPESVTVGRGGTVRFVNESGKDMWIGSNIHPTHSLYPIKDPDDCLGSSFDQCEATPTGTEWEFTFDAVGTFAYHNHVRSRDGGTVIVNE